MMSIQLILGWIKKKIARMAAIFPTDLPIGMTEFDQWAGSVIALTDLPDNDSMRFALATRVLHLGETQAAISKLHLARCLHKGAANQIAAGFMQDVKAKYDALAKQEKEAAATVTPAAADGPK